MHLGTVHASALYKCDTLGDVAVHVSQGHDGLKYEAGVKCPKTDAKVAVDQCVNLKLSKSCKFGDCVKMTYWFNLPVLTLMGGGLNDWENHVAFGTKFVVKEWFNW